MILYALACPCGHDFDQWFDNSADYDAKKGNGLICPSCGGSEVRKAIMAPFVSKKSGAHAALPAHPCNPVGCGNSMCPMAGNA